MGNQSSNSNCSYARRWSHGGGLRPGVAKDKLIFIIICSVALAVAAVTLVHFFTGGGKRGGPGQWQCVACGHEFTTKKKVRPPIDCPKPECDGEAVLLSYRTCPACEEKVLFCRTRMSGQAPGGGAPGSYMGVMQAADVQYWVMQDDGSYAWTPWMPGGSPQAVQVMQSLVCTECGASLFPASRSDR